MRAGVEVAAALAVACDEDRQFGLLIDYSGLNFFKFFEKKIKIFSKFFEKLSLNLTRVASLFDCV